MELNPIGHPTLGRLTESRVGRGEAGNDLIDWGGVPQAPIAGSGWLDQFPSHSARLSNGLATDREWSAFSYSSCLIRGFCDIEVVRAALADEGVFPVGAIRRGDATPKRWPRSG